ncbi:MAG: M48 family metallopeptidase [Bacillota bacterium]
MQLRAGTLWPLLVVLTGIFSLLYLLFTLFPGRVAPEALQYFSQEQIHQSRAYSQAVQLFFISSFIVEVAFLIWLFLSGRVFSLSRLIERISGGNYWGGVLLFFFVLWLLLRVINLPFSFLSSYTWQHRWGFSTQTLYSWWFDYFKAAGLGLLISAAGVLVLFWLIRRWPLSWWIYGAIFVSIWMVVQTFLWPVIIAPLFNRFEPARDPALLSMVSKLSEKAGLSVDRVLIMDASRRTTKANAYFAGLGRTKRVVLYDTLVQNYSPEEVEAVVAHELAHWSSGHIKKGLLLGVLVNFLIWGIMFILLRGVLSQRFLPPPYIWAMIALFFALTSFVGSPLENYYSRQMEREADRVSVVLTGNAPAAISLQQNLTVKNLSDVDPPAFIRWFNYSHPPFLERIQVINQTGGPG